MNSKTVLGSLIVACSLLASVPASAAYSWTFSRSDCAGKQASSGVKSDWFTSCSSTGTPSSAPDVTTTAWANTASGGKIESGYVGAYSDDPLHLGVVNKKEDGSQPNHAMDNNGYYDSLLMSFGGAVKLTSLQLNYANTDSDMTVLAYYGSGAPVLAGKSYADLLSAGWKLVGHYADVYNNANHAVTINADNYISQYWLIGAYNPLVDPANPGWSSTNDYVKLQSVSGETTRVPEPSSLLMFGLAFAGLVYARKRRPDVDGTGFA